MAHRTATALNPPRAGAFGELLLAAARKVWAVLRLLHEAAVEAHEMARKAQRRGTFIE